MFVPIINTSTYRCNVKVVNENIVYTDTVLDLKDLGSNIRVTSISEIGEYEFEICLRAILENNADVTFNTVQYSRAEKRLYFYTDKNISTTVWDERKKRLVQPITNKTEILEEIKRVLGEAEEIPQDAVTLYDVYRVMRSLNKKEKRINEKYETILTEITKAKIGNYSSVRLKGIDVFDGVLKIGFSYIDYNYNDIVFVKEDGDLRVLNSESIYHMDILEHCGALLSKLYDELVEFIPVKCDRKKDVKPINSRFRVFIDPDYSVSLYVAKPRSYDKDFEIMSKSFLDHDYDLTCNSTILMEAIKGKETEIFKRVYVNIDDCPNSLIKLLNELKWEQTQARKEKAEPNDAPEGVKKLTLCQRFKKWWESLE